MINLNDQTSYPNVPGFKVDGPSREAAVKEIGRAKTLRDRVVEVLRYGDKTADEVAMTMNETVLAVRPRLSELVKAGRIEDTGRRTPNESGHKATIWRLVNVTRVQAELLLSLLVCLAIFTAWTTF